jgi:hypothetical protein
MPVRLKFEHRRVPNVLHTWFEEGSAVSSHDDIRHLRDRLLHAILDCPAGPVWVLSLDRLAVGEQWGKAFEDLVTQVKGEGIKVLIVYSESNGENQRSHGAVATGTTVCTSKEEAFRKAAELS